MKIGSDKYFNLTYCANAHPGETWDETFSNLQKYIPRLKSALSPNGRFGIGLRLSNIASLDLVKPDAITAFKLWLNENDLYIFTINGFIYGRFHGGKVKERVFDPDWSTTDRRDYTIRLFEILNHILPDGIDGGVSTAPIAYKSGLNETGKEKVCDASALHIAALIEKMVELFEKGGKHLHLDIEPEPGCLLESSSDVIRYFEEWLFAGAAGLLMKSLGVERSKAEELILRHIKICFDVCHFAVNFERSIDALNNLTKAGIQIGKAHISSALRLMPGDCGDEYRGKVKQLLEPLTKSDYLHQAVVMQPDGLTKSYSDLVYALPNIKDNRSGEWRIHFHVPVFFKGLNYFQSTQFVTIETLKYLKSNKLTSHLEIETYTWEFLPQELKTDIVSSIQKEYEWTMGYFIKNE